MNPVRLERVVRKLRVAKTNETALMSAPRTRHGAGCAQPSRCEASLGYR